MAPKFFTCFVVSQVGKKHAVSLKKKRTKANSKDNDAIVTFFFCSAFFGLFAAQVWNCPEVVDRKDVLKYRRTTR